MSKRLEHILSRKKVRREGKRRLISNTERITNGEEPRRQPTPDRKG